MTKTKIMDIQISGKRNISARAELPASKSISNRMLVIRELCGGKIRVSNLSDCDDTFVMERALRAIHETQRNDTPKIGDFRGPRNSREGRITRRNAADPPLQIDIMAAGTSMRFLTALLSTMPVDVVITGTERMLHRPIGILVDALRQLGADIEYVGEQGFPPLRIRGGNLNGGEVEMRGDVSSQYISALMMIAPVMKNGLTLKIAGQLASRPYVEMTAGLMRRFGAKVETPQISREDGIYIIVNPGARGDTPSYSVENDWSAASYWYEIVALSDGGSVTLNGLCHPSLQGDAVVSRLFEPLGVKTEFRGSEAVLTRAGEAISYYEADLNACPDLAQTMVATCCAMGVRFRFGGLRSLRIKETDRLTALRQELRKLGFVIHEQDGSVLYWDGDLTAPEKAISIATYHDHRMAMCMAPLCMTGTPLTIQDAGVVSKSYPAFWSELGKAGFKIEKVN